MTEIFSAVPPEEAHKISPVTLAFLGDAVYSLYIRKELVLYRDFPAAKLQKLSSEKVSAHGQCLTLGIIEPLLTEEERDIVRRGRNAKKGTRSKSATVAEYNLSTGFEALLGYLYLTGQYDRIDFLLGEDNES